MKARTNWFDQGGRNYALFRPEYPPALAAQLTKLVQRRCLALDMGCGTGQLTLQLARHFTEVIGVDPSQEQLENTPPNDRVAWLCASAENIPLEDGSVDLITAAQAAHWFDRTEFYSEVRRLGAPGAILALISYGVLWLDNDVLNERFARFYHDEVGPFWPSERKLVDNGYADIDFPFEELPMPAMTIERDWKLSEFLGYISTWSAVWKLIEASGEQTLDDFAHEISALWRADDHTQRMT